jgi:hypothetical protein
MHYKSRNLHRGMKSNLEQFSCWQLLSNLLEFLINQKFFRQTDLNELWSDRLIENLIPNPSKLHFGQEVLHGDL